MKYKIELFDSVKKEKIEFEPIVSGEARIYVCGPTVYDHAHLGHARSAIAFDLLRRMLLENDFKVEFGRNFTDIDDKIINKMSQTGESLLEITERYINSYSRDMQDLGIIVPTVQPKATETIDEISHMVQELLDKDFAYRTSSGDIYFDTSRDKNYLSISGRYQNENERESRLNSIEDEKRNIADFVLWKHEKDGDLVKFESSLGNGRPGWHIECSAMIEKHLSHKNKNYSIDIHCGGADLLFPHHENEASQSRCATGHELAKYWLHNGFVKIDGEKMSKSLGNSFFVRDAIKKYGGEAIRFYLLSTHYRADFNFSEEELLNSKKRLDRIYRLKKRLSSYKISEAMLNSVFELDNLIFKNHLLKAMNDDLNISIVLAEIDKFVSTANESLDQNKKIDLSKIAQYVKNLKCINRLIGIGENNYSEYFQFGIGDEVKKEIEDLISQRTEAKKDKNFVLADEIRDQLKNMNVQIMDTINGVKWERVE